MHAPYVRTGYEAIVPIRVGDKFVVTAKIDGKVNWVTKTEMEVSYTTDSRTAKIVTERFKIANWTSKEESGACYTHVMVPNLKEGDKFIKDDTLIYDKLFFEPDIFNPKRVIYKQGDVINVALMEDPQTLDDSGAISKATSDRLSTIVTKIKSIVVSATDNISNMVKVDQAVEPNDSLFVISDGSLDDLESLDERSKEILQNLKSSSPKAKLKGTISKIVIYYNCELSELSKSLRALVNVSDAELVTATSYTGKVNSSYSISGKPLLAGEVEIKIYIHANDSMTIGDKAIFGNQLKFTVGEVFDYNMETMDGTKVDAVFSTKSIKARVVNSPDLIGTTSTLLDRVKDMSVKMYFGN